MPLASRTSRFLLSGILSSTILVAGAVQAQSRGDARGYVTDSYGNIVRSGAGECAREYLDTRQGYRVVNYGRSSAS